MVSNDVSPAVTDNRLWPDYQRYCLDIMTGALFGRIRMAGLS
jgi:hypothetical protein